MSKTILRALPFLSALLHGQTPQPPPTTVLEPSLSNIRKEKVRQKKLKQYMSQVGK